MVAKRNPDPILAQFDAKYYRRFYRDAATAIITKAEARAEVRFVLAFCSYYGLEIRRFADVGAGTGWWAREFSRQHPRCRDVETYDASPYAARMYGHRHVPIQKLGGRPADLVVCRDVLRYVSDADAREGIARLARKCRGVLYLHVLTRDDEVDEPASDMSGRLRSKRWYLKELAAAGFRNAGSGLFVAKKFKDFYCFAIEEL